MPVTIAVKGVAREGGALILSVMSDSPGLTISYQLTDSFAGPSYSNTLGYNGSTSTAGSTFDLPLRLYDDSEVGRPGTYRVSGGVTVNGVALMVNLSGVVTENDSPEFIVNTSTGYGSGAFNIARLDLDPFFLRQINDNSLGNRAAVRGLEAIASFPVTPITAPQVQVSVDMGPSVAITAYQFFTGKIVSLEGLDYLLKSANGLYSAYYTPFNMENRYINFAANLGLQGEGAVGFKAGYGALSLHDAVVKAFGEIVGGNDPAAIASIEASAGYFQQIARERIGGPDLDLATKAAMVGYVLEEAVKAHAGLYGHALENFYLDLWDGTAKTGVSLVAAYGPGTFVDGIG